MFNLRLISILTYKWQLLLQVTSEQYFNARYGFEDTKILEMDTHKSNTVYFKFDL